VRQTTTGAMTVLDQSIATARGDKRKIGSILNETGRLVHDQMKPVLDKSVAFLPSTSSRYSFCTAEGLAWAEFAARVPGYYEFLTKLLDGELTDQDVDWSRFAGRYGPEALRNACRGYREFKRLIPKRVLDGTAAAQELLHFQNSALVRAIDLSKHGWLRNFGSWLFCGPFKITAVMSPCMWNDAALQNLYMPLGTHVARGFRKLARVGVQDIVPSLLEETETGLADGGFTTLLIAHSFQSDLAKQSGGRVLHINTGLHVLGGGSDCASKL
jgi:hypothetical protein